MGCLCEVCIFQLFENLMRFWGVVAPARRKRRKANADIVTLAHRGIWHAIDHLALELDWIILGREGEEDG